MKIVLLVLSGDADRAQLILHEKFPAASFEIIARDDLEQHSSIQRIRFLRRLRPEIFAIVTERLVWQRGQTAFVLLGALAGANKTVIVDSHGGWKEESRAGALTTAPVRLAREAAISAATMKRAERQLRTLEAAVAEQKPDYGSADQDADHLQLVYLRSSPGPGSQAGGAASHINGVINAALQLGVDVSLISNDEIAGLDPANTRAKIIWPEPVGSTRAAFDIFNNLLFSERAAAAIEGEHPDLIYQRYARFSWVGVAASQRIRRPLFLEYNGSEVWVGRHWDRVGMLDLLARYEQLNLKAAARIFVVSEVERDNLLRAGVAPEKIVVNPNAVDVDRFQPHVGGAQVRKDLGVSDAEVLAGFIGTFGPWHGVEILAEAITQIPTSVKLRFLLIGSGALRNRVEQILRAAGAWDRVIMTGAVSHDRVPALLDACDILASPHVPLADGSAFFGSPTKLFEYMAMSKAIVASRLGQIGEVLTDEETALLVEPGNTKQLAQAILRLSKSRELRERLGVAARRAAVERHTWKRNAQRIIDEYQALSENRSR
jgi:glycosyltransferase involved in cell wall biosynthesis